MRQLHQWKTNTRNISSQCQARLRPNKTRKTWTQPTSPFLIILETVETLEKMSRAGKNGIPTKSNGLDDKSLCKIFVRWIGKPPIFVSRKKCRLECGGKSGQMAIYENGQKQRQRKQISWLKKHSNIFINNVIQYLQRLTRKELRRFRLALKSRKKLKKCGTRMQLHCDLDNDRKITADEWNLCTGAVKGT